MPGEYVPPPGVRLLFASRAELKAAPAEEREAARRIMDALFANPEDFGFRRETAADLQADDIVDRGIADLNGDW